MRGMWWRLVIPLSFLSVPSAVAPAQARAEIAGQVTDSAKVPLADVDVFILGAGRRTRTDSAGRYHFGELKAGSYSLVARKLGYRHGEADVALRAGATLRQDFALDRRVQLATVQVTARGECSMQTIGGFFCRQERFSGTFLDYPDIDFYGYTYTGDLFRHLKGWRVALHRAPDGGLVARPERLGRCVMWVVDGRVMPWERVPTYTADITGMEVYVRPDTIPPEIQREMNFGSAPSKGIHARSCDAVVFWTRRTGS